MWTTCLQPVLLVQNRVLVYNKVVVKLVVCDVRDANVIFHSRKSTVLLALCILYPLLLSSKNSIAQKLTETVFTDRIHTAQRTVTAAVIVAVRRH